MHRIVNLSLLAATAMVWSATASAGVYADDLGKCLVKSSSDKDQIVLAQWIFAALSEHPAVKPYSNFTDDQRVSVEKQGAELFQRLLTVDCHAQSVAAIKYEGASGLESSFTMLGQMATRSLMTDPHVTQSLGRLGSNMDDSKMQALFAEAGANEGGASK